MVVGNNWYTRILEKWKKNAKNGKCSEANLTFSAKCGVFVLNTSVSALKILRFHSQIILVPNRFLNMLLMKCLRSESMNETKKRSVIKSITWRLICIIISVLTAYVLTNKLDIAAAIGTIYNVITTILYYFHERAWNRIKWATQPNWSALKKRTRAIWGVTCNPQCPYFIA